MKDWSDVEFDSYKRREAEYWQSAVGVARVASMEAAEIKRIVTWFAKSFECRSAIIGRLTAANVFRIHLRASRCALDNR
jgi:hypothetical protein